MLTKWEAEIKRFERIDAAYAIGRFQRMNIVTSALPEKIQELIRAEKAKGELKTYEEFMSFVTTLTASSQYKRHDPPRSPFLRVLRLHSRWLRSSSAARAAVFLFVACANVVASFLEPYIVCPCSLCAKQFFDIYNV